MKCESAQRYILLAQSGELPERKRQELEKHVAGCPRCGEYRAQVCQILDAVKRALPAGEPGAAAKARIRDAAEELARRPSIIFFRPALPVLAYAALFLLLLGGGGYLYFAGKTGPGTGNSRVAEMSAIVAMVTEDEEFAAEVYGAENADHRALATQLLRLEGLNMDDLVPEDDSILPPEEGSQSEDSQSRANFRPAPAACA